MVLWGRSVLGRQKVPPRLRNFRGVSGLLGQIHLGPLGLPKGSVEGSTKPPRLPKIRYLSGLLGQVVLGC